MQYPKQYFIFFSLFSILFFCSFVQPAKAATFEYTATPSLTPENSGSDFFTVKLSIKATGLTTDTNAVIKLGHGTGTQFTATNTSDQQTLSAINVYSATFTLTAVSSVLNSPTY